MAQNRSERPLLSSNSLPIQMEVLRQSSESSKPQDSGKEETKIPLFWRVFGGTVLSISALIIMTAYQSLSGNIADLGRQFDHLDTDMRKEMARLAELNGELVRKDECESRFRGVWTQLNEFNRCQESARNAMMPALDSTRKIFHPIDNRFLQIPDNVPSIAAVNRGNEFSGTFGIDAAQFDRFAPLR